MLGVAIRTPYCLKMEDVEVRAEVVCSIWRLLAFPKLMEEVNCNLVL
jgi:hypothetical protein